MVLALYNTVVIFHAPDSGKRISSTAGETGGPIETPQDKPREWVLDLSLQ